MRKKRKIKPIIRHFLLPDLRGKKLCVDTNFLIESIRHEFVFADIIEHINASGLTCFYAPLHVQIEFVMNVQTKQELQILQGYLDKTVHTVKKDTMALSFHYSDAIKLARTNVKTPSLTDLSLICELLADPSSLLLTKNHTDFPTTFLRREGYIIVEYINTIQNYAFYRLDRDKSHDIITEFNS